MTIQRYAINANATAQDAFATACARFARKPFYQREIVQFGTARTEYKVEATAREHTYFEGVRDGINAVCHNPK